MRCNQEEVHVYNNNFIYIELVKLKAKHAPTALDCVHRR